MVKGQVELVIILGIIFLFIVVMFSSFGSNFFANPVPSGVAERQAAVNTLVMGVIKDGVKDTLRTLELHGGYLEDPSIAGKSWEDVPNVEFMKTGVAYWQMCENNYSPKKEDVKRYFELAAAKYIRDNINQVSDLYGRNVSFDPRNIKVEANILGANPGEPKKIDVTVTLPTTVDGYDMPSQYHPYKHSIDTEFGEILQFAADLAEDNAKNRNLEVFTIYGVYFSQDLDGFGKLPTTGVLTECGQFLFRDAEQIDMYLMELVKYIITQIRWWDVMSTDYSIPKIFAIQSLDGKEYRDLDIYMRIPDNFGFDNHDFVMYVNNEREVTTSVLIPPVCIEAFNRGYNVNYPVIISVKDRETGGFFNFASHVYVESEGLHMYPGSCGSIKSPGSDKCQDLSCEVNMRVVDDLSVPMEGVFVSYGNCPVGYTDSNGRVTAPSMCSGELTIYKNSSYEFYQEEDILNQNLKDTYVLHKVPEFQAHFREVSIYLDYKYYGDSFWATCTPCGSGCNTGMAYDTRVRCEVDLMDREYMYLDFTPKYRDDLTLPISNIDSDSVDPDCMESEACKRCTEESENVNKNNMNEVQGDCQQCSIDCASDVTENRDVEYLPSGTHTVEGFVLDPYTSREAGGVITTYTLDRNEDEVYINMPRSEKKSGNNYQVSDSEKSCLTSYLSTCDIDPISATEPIQKTIVMKCTCENLLELVNETNLWYETQDRFCTCPLGSAYSSGCCDSLPLGCLGVCDGCKVMGPDGCSVYLPVCATCCDSSWLVDYINSNSVQLQTNTRLICS